ncbi:MAG: hypothetical protein ABII10_03300 [Candidatus Paceibacterota bacterium]
MNKSNGRGKEIGRTVGFLGQRIASLSPEALQCLINQAEKTNQEDSPQNRLDFFLNYYELSEVTISQINRLLRTAKKLGESGISPYLFYLYLNFGLEEFEQNFLELKQQLTTG